uniref:Uncharacterized protein n=1 Tax=viral metagenome TaxID=1070528 RepID=A0A6H1ZPL1_9ZZZZ
MPKEQIEQIGIITKQGNIVTVKWADGVPQIKKVELLYSLSMAEHEVFVRHKYFAQSNIIDPHTQKNVLIPKEKGTPN